MARLWLLLLLLAALLLAACHAPPSTSSHVTAAQANGEKDAGPASLTAPSAADKGSGTDRSDEVDVREVRRALTAREAAAYLGDATCASCHKAAASAHSQSRHAHTLRAVSLQQDGPTFRSVQSLTDPVLRYSYAPAVQQGNCVLRGRNARGQSQLSADYVMGSGHNAFTYLSRDDSRGWVELRLSYYPHVHKWDYTPTQLPGTKLTRAAGRVQTNAMLTSCLLCHTTVLRAALPAPSNGPSNASPDDPRPDIAASLLGVGCERCHGPGRAHVRMVTQAGAAVSADIARHNTYGMEDLRHASPERINAICGYCHRTPENAPANDPHTEISMPRFQGVALARSACYQKSGVLSCLTCHDAHGNANPSLSRNDAICLRCHSAPIARPHNAEIAAPLHAPSLPSVGQQHAPLLLTAEKAVQGKICPVNTRTGCTTCHMPKQTIPDIPHASYTNHWIKVWRNAALPSS